MFLFLQSSVFFPALFRVGKGWCPTAPRWWCQLSTQQTWPPSWRTPRRWFRCPLAPSPPLTGPPNSKWVCAVSGIVQLTLRFPWNNMFMSFQFSGNIFRVSYSNVWQLLTDSGLPIFMTDLNSWFHPCFVILVQKLPLNLLIMQQMTTGHWVDLERD